MAKSIRKAKAPALTLDQLPRLSDEDREALESGYVALQGVPASDGQADDDRLNELDVESGVRPMVVSQLQEALCMLRKGEQADGIAQLTDTIRMAHCALTDVHAQIEHVSDVAYTCGIALQTEPETAASVARVLSRMCAELADVDAILTDVLEESPTE